MDATIRISTKTWAEIEIDCAMEILESRAHEAGKLEFERNHNDFIYDRIRFTHQSWMVTRHTYRDTKGYEVTVDLDAQHPQFGRFCWARKAPLTVTGDDAAIVALCADPFIFTGFDGSVSVQAQA